MFVPSLSWFTPSNRCISITLCRFHTKSILCHPIKNKANGEVVAVLQCINKGGGVPFDEYDESMMQEFSDEVGVVLAGAVQKMKTTDKDRQDGQDDDRSSSPEGSSRGDSTSTTLSRASSTWGTSECGDDGDSGDDGDRGDGGGFGEFGHGINYGYLSQDESLTAVRAVARPATIQVAMPSVRAAADGQRR